MGEKKTNAVLHNVKNIMQNKTKNSDNNNNNMYLNASMSMNLDLGQKNNCPIRCAGILKKHGNTRTLTNAIYSSWCYLPDNKRKKTH